MPTLFAPGHSIPEPTRFRQNSSHSYPDMSTRGMASDVALGMVLDEEECARDMAAFSATSRTRFWIIIAAVGFLISSRTLGLVDQPFAILVPLSLFALGLSLVVTAIGRSRSLYRWWLKYVFMLCDIVLISLLVVLFGQAMLVIVYLIVIVPYSFDRTPLVGHVAALASAGAFAAASVAYTHFSVDSTAIPLWSQILPAIALLLFVAQQITPMHSNMLLRIHRTRECMVRVEHGDLTARIPTHQLDELGYLENGFNRMADELSVLIGAVRHGVDDLVAVTTELSNAVQALERRSQGVVEGSDQLSDELRQQLERAGLGVRTGQEARQTADIARRTAEATARAAHVLDEAALTSREAIERAAQALLAVRHDVGDAARLVRALEPASDQVGEFVETVSRIAQQTKLLALNAAIEASRAGAEGVGFAVVAEEIRALAAESSLAAKRVASTVQRVRNDVTVAVGAMDHTVSEVEDAGTIARDATRALASMVDGIARVARQSDEVSTLAIAQAELSTAAAAVFETLDGSAQRAAMNAQLAHDEALAWQAGSEALSRNSVQLVGTTARMRKVASRQTE